MFLNGGWNATYQSKSGVPTMLNGDLALKNGNCIVETAVLQGKLVINGGRLVADDVKVK